MEQNELAMRQEYITKRLKEIYEEKVATLKGQCADPVLPATQRDLQNMIVEGYIKVISPSKRLIGNSFLTSVFEFPHGWEGDQGLTGNYESRLKKLTKVYKCNKDEAILNSGQYLPALIRNFESYVV